MKISKIILFIFTCIICSAGITYALYAQGSVSWEKQVVPFGELAVPGCMALVIALPLLTLGFLFHKKSMDNGFLWAMVGSIIGCTLLYPATYLFPKGWGVHIGTIVVNGTEGILPMFLFTAICFAALNGAVLKNIKMY